DQRGVMRHHLRMINDLTVHRNFSILASYKEDLVDYFEATTLSMDFSNDPSGSTDQINGWVRKQTSGKIARLLDSPLHPNTTMVLLNAITFSAAWREKFRHFSTKAPFLVKRVKTIEKRLIPFMEVHDHFGYVCHDDGQLIELPF